MGLLSRLFDDTPGLGQPTPAPSASACDDSTPALRRKHAEVIRVVNRLGGELPTLGTVLARRITDAVGAVITRADVDHLDPHARITINAMLTDYLPRALGTYVASARAGHDDQTALLGQLHALYESAGTILAATQANDIQALEVQSIFLSTKFSGSDLDL